jgi:hypothetical protein
MIRGYISFLSKSGLDYGEYFTSVEYKTPNQIGEGA